MTARLDDIQVGRLARKMMTSPIIRSQCDLKVASRSPMWRNILPRRRRVSCSFARLVEMAAGHGEHSSHADRGDILGKIEWTGSQYNGISSHQKVAC